MDLGVDYNKLLTESEDKKYDTQLAQDKQDAIELGIKATPSFIINNQIRVTGGLPLTEIVKYIDME
jgi:protein-disulfide isomerase